MNYQDQHTPVPQDQREELNKKIIYLIDSGKAEACGISREDIFNAYTGLGGLHGLKREDFANYHEYSEEKKQFENGQFFTPPALCELIMACLRPSEHDLVADLTCGMGNFFNYSRMLEMVCDQWDLHGFHRVTYEYHAEKLRAIAKKYQAGIHYDYDAAVEKCRKKQAKKQRDDDPGGDALDLAFLKAQREHAKAEEKGLQRELSSGQ